MNENGLPDNPSEHFFYCVQWLGTQRRIFRQAIEDSNNPLDKAVYEAKQEAFEQAEDLVAEHYRMAYSPVNGKVVSKE
jgi:hypothetical protein